MTDRTISPLRRRMGGDMTIRGFTPSTQRGYLAAITDFTAFLGRSPDGATVEDLRRYQLHMRSSGASATSMNAAVSGMHFFFTVTLCRDDAQVRMTTVRATDLGMATLRSIATPNPLVLLETLWTAALDAWPTLYWRRPPMPPPEW